MLTNLSPVIVKLSEGDVAVASSKLVHHRNFPEIRAEASSALEALAHLRNMLARALDGVGSIYHRSLIEEAISDVAEVIAGLDSGEQSHELPCSVDALNPDIHAQSLYDPDIPGSRYQLCGRLRGGIRRLPQFSEYQLRAASSPGTLEATVLHF